MRFRRGLSPRTEAAVARLSEQDVEDLLTAMPFLAPVLPVPSTGPPQASTITGRTPRKGSKGGSKLTPRLSARGPSDITGGNRSGASSVPIVDYPLSLSELELVTKAWTQVLASGATSGAANDGGPSSPLKNAAAAQVATVATLFGKACTSAAHLSTGRQLQDVLRLLHVPVLPTIEGLLGSVVGLLGSAVNAPSSDVAGPSSPKSSDGWLHFSKFLEFLSACKHLDAIQRHRRFCKSAQNRSGRDEVLVNEDDEEPTEVMEMADLETSFEHLATEMRHDDVRGDLDSHSSSSGPVTVESLQMFAANFDLSIEAVIPRQFLTPPPTTTVASPVVTEHHRTTPLPTGRLMSVQPVTKAKWTLTPGSTKMSVSLVDYANHVGADTGDGDCDGPKHGIDDTQAITKPPTAVRVDGDQKRSATSKLANVLRLSLPSRRHDASQAPGATASQDATSAKQLHSRVSTAASAGSGQQLSVSALSTHATWVEKRSPLSTMQLPPLTYLSFQRSKEAKRLADHARREREHQLREEYLYGPPRPKPKKLSAEEESLILLHEATSLVEEQLNLGQLFSVDMLRGHIQAKHELRKHAEQKEANRYSFLMPDRVSHESKGATAVRQPLPMAEAVRKCAAQELLAMLQRCPEDSILGTQSSVRRERRRRGLNGLELSTEK